MKNIKLKFKNFFKNTREKSEEEKMRLVWFLAILFMTGIFLLWVSTTLRNFSNLSGYRSEISGLPKFPEKGKADLENSFNESRQAIDDLINKGEGDLKWNEMGEKYIKENNIFANDEFSTLKLFETRQENDKAILDYRHYYKEVLVLGSNLLLSVDPKTMQVAGMQNNLKKIAVDIDVNPKISAKEASEIAKKEANDSGYEFGEAKLAIVESEGKFYLVWKTVFNSKDKMDAKEVLVGAQRGSVVE